MASSSVSSRHSLDVNLSTVELVQEVLEHAETPVSRAWLLKELADRGRSTNRPRLNRALRYFFKLGLAVEGTKGVQWTHNLSPNLQHALSVGRRV
ncbi:MAG: hypothetical protein ACLP74_08375 [Thermoplasmata archaeon]